MSQLRFLFSLTVISVLALSLTGHVLAQQFDAPYVAAQMKNAEKWAAEDARVDKKLAALRKKFGKNPNIIYILTDDIGWGELGWQGGGKHRGHPTPNLDQMAHEGMRFQWAYSEPSCTPSRIAINTGRHPVRTGVKSVMFPGESLGLPPEEVTIAEVLKKAGYDTAMWGKWHMGELVEQAPENQGYDTTYYGLFNGGPSSMESSFEMRQGAMPHAATTHFHGFPGYDAMAERYGIKSPHGFFKGGRGKEREPVGGMNQKELVKHEKESFKQIITYVKDHANSDNPFFIYWASYANQLAGVEEYEKTKYVNSQNPQSSFMAMHDVQVGQLLDTLKESKIAENTLVVWISDNGPAYYWYPNAGFSYLRGGKGDVLEGGVRVPAMAWWPGMIEPEQDPLDMIQITDLFTTAARLGGAMKHIPSDRVTDGIDQSALFTLGEDHGRRHYIMHYSGNGDLAAVRLRDHKLGGLNEEVFGIKLYHIPLDPREERHQIGYAWMLVPFKTLIGGHMALNKKFPHRDLGFTPTIPLMEFFGMTE